MIANKSIKITIFLPALLAAAVPAFSGDLQLKARAAEYLVEATIDRQPPVVGDNKIGIEIKDVGGAPVTDAKVLVNYYMPPMPRMAPMNYKVKADLKDKTYRAKMKFIMSGPWIIAVKITREDKTITAKFNVDAR